MPAAWPVSQARSWGSSWSSGESSTTHSAPLADVGAKRILVVSYTFPPMPTVGGNRWLAMSKYLRRAGYEVEILTTSAFGSLPGDHDESVHRATDLVGATWLRRALRRPQIPKPGEPAVDDTPPPALVTKVVVPDH